MGLFVVRNIGIPVFKYMFGYLHSIKNNGNSNRVQILERKVHIMLPTNIWTSTF